MDLNDLGLKVDEAATIQIVHPVLGRVEGLTLDVLGKDSKAFKQARREILDRKLKQAAKRGSLVPDADDEDLGFELIARVTTGWGAAFSEGGQPIPCTYDNVLKLYSDPRYAWLYEQADRAVGDRENFFGK